MENMRYIARRIAEIILPVLHMILTMAIAVIAVAQVHPDSLSADSTAYRQQAGAQMMVPLALPGPPNISYTIPGQLQAGVSVSFNPTNTGDPVYADGDVSTFAGSGVAGYINGTGTAAVFNYPSGIVSDVLGNLYVSDFRNHVIRKVTQAGVVTTFAGSGTAGTANGTGTSAQFNGPNGIAIDGSGNLYVADRSSHRIRKITSLGVVTTLAGSTQGSANGTGTAAQFNTPTDVAVDGAGNVYVTEDAGHRIRKITPSGVVSTLAGSGSPGNANGTGTAASFNYPQGLAIDDAGNLYVADQINDRIQKVTPSGTVTTFATGLARPVSLERDASGNIYAGLAGHKLIKISTAGVLTHVAGTGSAGYANGAPMSAAFKFIGGITFYPQGNLYIADQQNNRIRRMGNGQGYSINPELPAGLTLNRTTGVISGTPVAAVISKTYTITAHNAGGSDPFTVTFSVVGGAFSADRNYILKTVYLGRYTSSQGNPPVDSALQDINYFDGLGRSEQEIGIKATPSKTKDVVMPVAYDVYGRQEYNYLPYATAVGIGGTFKANAVTAQNNYYSSSATVPEGQTAHAYARSRTIFEPSPMNRVLEQGFPGRTWQPASSRTTTTGHTVVTEYAANNTVDTTDKANTRMVSRYGVTLSAAGVPTLTLNGTYAANELYVTVTKDENWSGPGSTFINRLHTMEEYTDKQGRVVLRRTFNRVGSSTDQLLSTYYVYNDLGQLSFVLTPELKPDRKGTVAPSVTELERFAYRYVYDGRGRVVEKWLPGKEVEYTVYNRLDRVVATQDANQRAKSPQEWTVTKYDALGRAVLTGTWKNTGNLSLATIRSQVDGQSGFNAWEERPSTAYTNRSWPTAATGSLTVLTEEFYDNYGIADIPNNQSASYSKLLHGRHTASRVNVLGTSTYLWSVYYYDDKGNVTGEWKQHYLGGSSTAGKFDDIKREYTFTGRVKKETRKHHTTSATSSEATVVTEYGYDHRERPLRTWKTVIPKEASTGRRILLSENTYNEVGQLYVKKLHSDAEGMGVPSQVTLDAGDVVSAGQERTVRAGESIILAPGFHAQQGSYFHALIGGGVGQEIRYAYNERGWLSATGSGLFRQTLRYADTALNPQYNGNISHQVFSRRAATGSTPAWLTDTYSYTYDGVNRLLQGAMTGNKGRETLTYDRNGNIRTLVRTGTGSTAVDDLTLNYTGNRLTGVADAAASTDANYQLPGTMGYTYDANGNLLTRVNSGSTGNNITAIVYNYLNLPQSVTATAGNVAYVYDATGRKLRSTGGMVGQTRDYIDGIEYYNGTMELIHTEEGRIVRSGNVYEYDYFIRDHLGNNRTGFKEGSDVTVPNFTADYYPFGLPYIHNTFSRPGSPKNNYLYNDKELQDGIRQYDYGARFYDPVIGRWGSVDPLAESYQGWSPYNYTLNNPMRFIDPNGMWVDDYIFDENGNYVRTEETEHPHRLIVENSQSGDRQAYQFADPDEDSKAIDDGIINKVVFVSESQISRMLRQQDVFNPENKDGWRNFYDESTGGGKYDYSYSVIPSEFEAQGAVSNPLSKPSPILFLPQGDNMVHNHMNFGNYLWAASGYTLGFSYSTLRSAAHGNSVFNSRKNGYSSQLDSNDDQRSIIKGAYFSDRNGYRRILDNMVKFQKIRGK